MIYLRRYLRFTISLVVTCGAVFAQTQAGKLQVKDYQGAVRLVRVDGRRFVDVQALAEITGSSLVCDGNECVLTLPATRPSSEAEKAGFSRPFMAAAIEALASMREWSSTVAFSVKGSFQLGPSVDAYRNRAEEKAGVAAAAATSADDRRGLELLRSELSNVGSWTEQLIQAQKTMNSGNLAMTAGALEQDPTYLSIVACGQAVSQMLGSGRFQDVSECR
jgi:hypothetical protein